MKTLSQVFVGIVIGISLYAIGLQVADEPEPWVPAPTPPQVTVPEYPAVLQSLETHPNEYGSPTYYFTVNNETWVIQAELSYGADGRFLSESPPTKDQVGVEGIWVVFPYGTGKYWAAYHNGSKK